MKILITGSTGLLGQALSRHLATRAEVVGLSRRAPAVPSGVRHVVCDVREADVIGRIVSQEAPDLVINAQALSDVDQCEIDAALAESMNVEATAHVVRAVASLPALLVHCSTDYVFDGSKDRPYDERDTPQPLSVYGRTKLAGERAVLAHPRGVVVRTSTLFGAGRTNFCDYVVAQLTAGQPVQAFVDQVTTPTFTDDAAAAMYELAQALLRTWSPQCARVFHVTNGGACSRVAFAQRVADRLGCRDELIQRISIRAQNRPAPRPAYSALTSLYVPQLIGRTLRPWDDALDAYLRQRRWLD